MLIFLDTEFTRLPPPLSESYRPRPRLISLALVANTGEELYAEVPFPKAECSEFVRETVIPLLGKHPDAFCMIEDLGARITEWLEGAKGSNEGVEVCFDFQTDWDLMVEALNNAIPLWCKPRHISARNINQLLRVSYFKKHGLPEHHALYDARAARYAFRERPPVAMTGQERPSSHADD